MQLVSGNLQLHKPVVGQIIIERLDHPVAVTPGIGPHLVMLETIGLGKARQVQPVLRPVLPVGG